MAEDMTMENIQKLSLDHMDRSDLPKLYKVYKISHGLRSRFDSEKGRIMKKISNVSIARIKMINQSTTSDGTNNGVSKLSQPGNDVAIILSQINDILGLKCLKLTTKNIQTAIDNISRSNYFIRDLKSIEKKLSHIDTKNLPSAAIEMLTRIKRKIRLVIIERKGTEKPKISNKQEIRNWISNMEKYLEQVDVAYQKLLESQNDETAIFKEKVRLFRSYLYNQYENTIVIPLGLDDAKKAVTLSRWEKKKTIRILLERIIAWGQLYGPTGMSEEDFFDLCKHGSVLHGIHTIANKFEQERSNLFPQKKEKIIINDILVPSHITHNDTKQKKKISSQRKTLREIQQEISDMKKRIEQYTSNYDHMDLAKKVCNDLLERIA